MTTLRAPRFTIRLVAILHTFALFALIQPLCAQRPFTVMAYNIENAFDTIHDTGKNDYEYCAGGTRKWNTQRLFRKLRGIGQAIAAADEHRPVDLIALCEVENDTVAEYLTRRTPLRHASYRYLITHSADPRGIDVALLYSPYTFHPVDTQHIRPSFPHYSSRDILHVAGTIQGGDTIDIYVVHLPSKRGGASARKRSLQTTRILKQHIDSIRNARQHPNLIVAGDFNADCHSAQLTLLTNDSLLRDHSLGLRPGTYKYQGEWNTLDHILTHTTTLTHVRSRILAPPFLTEADDTHGGIKPLRTYLGPVYVGGISDHLPVVSTFHIQAHPVSSP